jgi:ABC-type multidrug transport system permease subunit
MYRVSPFTYLVSAILSIGLLGKRAFSSDIETLKVAQASGQTCGAYLGL